MSLVNAERRRLFRRRFTRYMLLIAVLVLGMVVAGTWLGNQKVGPAQIAAAERQAEQEYQRAADSFRERCIRIADDASTEARDKEACESGESGLRPEHFRAERYLPSTFEFKKEFGNTLLVLFSILALVAFMIGASFVGAEWSTGGMVNLLIWRPRRLQVLLTKLGTLLGGLLAIGGAASAVWLAAFWAIGTYRGTTTGMTQGAWESIALSGARGMGLALAAAVIGFGLASFGRHTAMALGLAIGFAVVGYVGVGIALALVQVRFAERYLWPTYLEAWMAKKKVLLDFESCDFEVTAGDCQPRTLEITWQDSGLIFAGVTAAVLLLALWSMHRRDVT